VEVAPLVQIHRRMELLMAVLVVERAQVDSQVLVAAAELHQFS
jgi:hypothetical protein